MEKDLNNKDYKKIVILGAGITGLTAAWELSKLYKDKVILIEKENTIGGLASSFNHKNFTFDIGSHRLHNDGSEVFKIIRSLCGNELLKRERKGKILIKNKFIKYPPSPIDIISSFGLIQGVKFAYDLLIAQLLAPFKTKRTSSFESYITSKIGKSLYTSFYKPYAWKLWAHDPSAISNEPAINRIRKFSFLSLIKNIKDNIKSNGSTYYYYPEKGIGYLSNRIKDEFIAMGGSVIFIDEIEKINLKDDKEVKSLLYKDKYGISKEIDIEILVSTIPMNSFYNIMNDSMTNKNGNLLNLKWRSLRILYLLVKDKINFDSETLYFPESNTIIGRVSEISKYSPALNGDSSVSALTIEIPCTYKDELWSMDDKSLTTICLKELKKLGVLKTDSSSVLEAFSKKIKDLYPIYEIGWKEKYERIYGQLDSIENLFMIGRSALFLHCNIDHCMDMGLKLAKFITNGRENKNEWNKIRQEFFKYKVRE